MKRVDVCKPQRIEWQHPRKWWLLPLWAVLFPYNLFAAQSWWVTCRVLGVRPAEPPPEAFEGEAGPLVTLDMAARGIRP